MAVYNRLPVTNLTGADIRDTLNAYGGSVDNNTLSFFSESANINKWSRHKPIVINKTPSVIMFVDYTDDIWRNQDGSTPNPTRDLATAFQGSQESQWFNYKLPTGGEYEPFRLGDFRGYRADATSPFRDFYVDNIETTYMDSTQFTIYIRYYLNNDDDPVEGGMIALSDIQAMDASWNTIKVGVVDYFKGSYTLYQGDSISTNWGYGHINIDWADSVNYKGLHEFAAVLVKSDGSIYPLPFNRIKVNVIESNVNNHFNMTIASLNSLQFEARAEILWGTQNDSNLKTRVVFELVDANDYIQQSFTSNNEVNLTPGTYGYPEVVVSLYSIYDSVKQMAERGELYCRARINSIGWISNKVLVQTN